MAKPPVTPRRCCLARLFAPLALVMAGGAILFGQTLGSAPAEGPMLGPDGRPLLAVQPPPAAGLPAEEMVVEVRIEGNRTVKLEKILPHVHTRAGRPYDPNQIEKDVRDLNRTRLFVTIRPLSKQVPGGRLVIFQVVERPVLQSVTIIGNESISKKTLLKETELKVNGAADPFAVEEGRRKIEDLYQKKGFSKVRVTVLDGNKPGDLKAVYLISEGPKQKILWISFVGNTIVSGARLQTQIKSRHPYVWLFKGEVDRKLIDEDVERLIAYYRGLGFFRARVGRELEFNEKQDWLTLTFVIDEGPRYKIRNISINGNRRLATEQLAAKLKLQSGEFFNQGKMTQDVTALQDQYGGIGYVFADIKPENRFLDEPGQLDLVYNVSEGDRYRVGRIDVEIKGENAHTRITTVLNRLSLSPGDVVDVRKLRESERRLKASALFLNDPTKNAVPKLVYRPPELEDKDKETEVADRPTSRTSYYDGRMPQGMGQPDWRPALPPLPPGESYADVTLQYDSEEDLRQDEQAPPPDGPVQPLKPPFIVRGQIGMDSGISMPQMPSQPAAPRMPAGGQAAFTPISTNGSAAAYQAAPQYPTNPGLPPASAYAAPPQQGYPPPQQGYPQQGYVPQQGYPPQAAQPAPAFSGPPGYATPPGTVYGNSPVAQPCPTPPPVGVPGLAGPNARVFGDLTPYTIPGPNGEPLRDLPIKFQGEETQTGRLMFGVGVNSEAGLVGSITLDEQNFDWTRVPTSWEDIRNGTAFRGAGQRFRLEAVPGTQVQRYMVTFQEPYLMDQPVSLGLNGFYYERIYNEWTESRAGGRVSLGYQFTHDLTGTVAFRGQNVNIKNVEDVLVEGLTIPDPNLEALKGNSQLYGFSVQLAHDTRDNAFLATEGHMIQASFEEVTGSFTYPHVEIEANQFFKVYERADGSGRHVVSLSARAGWSGDETPYFERYYAGGFSTIRGFAFRGVSPRDQYGVVNGGDFQLLTSVQYMFPITADDMLRGVFFVDAGTVEPTIRQWDEHYRVAPGFGLRITIPMMGPAPIALDFAFPVVTQPGDQREVFSFFVGFNR